MIQEEMFYDKGIFASFRVPGGFVLTPDQHRLPTSSAKTSLPKVMHIEGWYPLSAVPGLAEWTHHVSISEVNIAKYIAHVSLWSRNGYQMLRTEPTACALAIP